MKPENVKCPDCGGPMVSRTAKSRIGFGDEPQRFWGCAQFPKCRGTRDTDGHSKADRHADRGYREDADDDLGFHHKPSRRYD